MAKGDWTDLEETVREAKDWSLRAYDQANQIFYNAQERLGDTSFGDLWKSSFDMIPGLGGARDKAYPVPTVSQYANCKAQGGDSGWDQRGVWRCLFPNTDRPDKFFPDYTQFLEFKRKAWEESQKQQQLAAPAGSPWPLSSRKPRVISADEAKGKQVVGESVFVESTKDEDNAPVSRKRVVTYYNDDTATVEETSDNGGWFWK